MRTHGAAAEREREARELVERFLAETQALARQLRPALDIPEYKPIRGFRPQEVA